MAQISSYVPELEFFRDKDQYAPRFWEDCAVMDMADGSVLASREADIRSGKSVFQNAEIVDQIRAYAAGMTERRGMFSLPKKTVLIFADFLRTTGMIVVLALPERIEKVIHGMRRIGRSDFSLPQAKTREPELTAEQTECLSALLFHMDSFFSEEKGIKRMTQILRIANFAGCRIDFADLTPERLYLRREDEERLRLFLLCIFLQLRKRSGKVSLQESESDDVWKVTVGQKSYLGTLLPLGQNGCNLSEAFSDFRLHETENGIFAQAVLRAEKPFARTIRSGSVPNFVQLVFTFSILPKVIPKPMELPKFTI